MKLPSLFAASGLILALIGALVVSASDEAWAKNPAIIKLDDNCDPATFNAVLGAGACVEGGGNVTFEQFIAALETRPDHSVLQGGNVKGWKFSPKTLRIGADETVIARNEGGEFHTFSQVEEFGGGCVPDLNVFFALTPVPECDDPTIFDTTGVPAGASLEVGPLAEGSNHFQCLIHPWQRVTLEVR